MSSGKGGDSEVLTLCSKQRKWDAWIGECFSGLGLGGSKMMSPFQKE